VDSIRRPLDSLSGRIGRTVTAYKGCGQEVHGCRADLVLAQKQTGNKQVFCYQDQLQSIFLIKTCAAC
jgi:hypothetical protein